MGHGNLKSGVKKYERFSMIPPYTTALMDIDASIPTSCSYKFYFSESFKTHKIEEVATFVSGVYSKCLNAGGECCNQTQIGEGEIDLRLTLGTPLCAPIPSKCVYIFDNSEDAAHFVSDVYSKFPPLTLDEKKKLGKSRVNFGKISQPVTKEQIFTFKKALKDRIIKDLTQDKFIELSTDNGPEDVLRDVAAFAFKELLTLAGLFPLKSFALVTVLTTKIEVRMSFFGS